MFYFLYKTFFFLSILTRFGAFSNDDRKIFKSSNLHQAPVEKGKKKSDHWLTSFLKEIVCIDFFQWFFLEVDFTKSDLKIWFLLAGFLPGSV